MMSTNKIFFLSAVLLGLSACAKDTFTTYTGNMPSEDKIERLAPGMGREQVRELLGSPSSVVSLDRDTWIYMSAEIEQIAFMRPEETERRLLVVKFGQDGKVADMTKAEDRFGACKWYIDEVLKRYRKQKYKYVDLVGFYYVTEETSGAGTLMTDLSAYLHAKGYPFTWIPYYNAPGWNLSKEKG